MKTIKLILLLIVASGLIFTTSCNKKKIDDLEAEVAALEKDKTALNDSLTNHQHDSLMNINHHGTIVKAEDWIADADWANATEVTLTFKEGTNWGFTTSPSPLVFTTGKPYVLKIINPVGNTEKHYFATDGPTNFFTAIATKEVETADAHYEAPFFEAIELLKPTSVSPEADREVEILFVPVLTGKYHIICTISGHQAAGMEDYITITGDEGLQLDFEIPTDFNTALTRDSRKSGSHSVWSSRVDTTVILSDYAFSPDTLNLTKDVAYKITLKNSSMTMHHWTADEFNENVVIRKVQDSHAEVKPYYMHHIGVMMMKSIDVYIVPVKAGTYYLECDIAGHVAQGMEGAIVVQ